MKLTAKDLRHLMYMERWASYKAEDGALSLEEIIRQDRLAGRKNFSTILGDKDTVVQSFGMENIPKANVLLVFGSCPRAVAYAAEIAIRHNNLYGYYPEFVAVGDGRGMFRQRVDMACWFENMMVELGFDQDWVKSHHVAELKKNRPYIAETSDKLEGIFCLKKTRVLAVTGAGYSLRAAQELPMAMPHIEFNFFEVPQLELSARLFDNEVFASGTYAVDALLASVVCTQLPEAKITLSLEKKFSRPEMRYIGELLLRGYAGYFCKPEMWKLVGISPERGAKLHESRKAELQQLSPYRFQDQTRRFKECLNRSLADKGLSVG